MSRPKGLKRAGLRSYKVGTWIITRDRPWRWLLRHETLAGIPPELYAIRCKSLTQALQFLGRL